MAAAAVAAIMSIIEFIELVWGKTGLTQEYVEAILMILAPILVWLIPNWRTANRRREM
jgi:hypothetical protein